MGVCLLDLEVIQDFRLLDFWTVDIRHWTIDLILLMLDYQIFRVQVQRPMSNVQCQNVNVYPK